MGPWFNLLRIGPDAPAASAFEQAASALGIPLNIVQVGEAAAEELYQAKLLLVRPDQHIAWRGDAIPQDISAVMNAVIGKKALPN